MKDERENSQQFMSKRENGGLDTYEELSGANTQGRTLEEAYEGLKKFVQLIIEANGGLARRETGG